ncbi:G_PROTEIN_RECEP_F1_2 domain-containing protein [Caenorhabditis elegans]|uniref:G_PROTEIN_RECEP_F1_2 domain-containing protein n=1 Tax=Caenorhabditis elegans TaxID=6239 RepID=A0A2X0RCX2_CAEEL|nr:G_PROTEIN_RECEP_F1_2 domain-containing protein [Caenorhabditis elegans]SPS41583.1 G_PROTEIN_RECEP_F1_2 domain-containing protein [Caenorhabditis elegans]|eukprot:NP_001350989.1 Uncharacterized protein CELE_Y71H2AM.29 [Caenorhabditis elegans]
MVDGCAEKFEQMSSWIVLISIVPITFSFITVILLCSSLLKVKKMRGICDGIHSNAHWLSRTAVRVGIGATARVTINEYASTKPELKRLLK